MAETRAFVTVPEAARRLGVAPTTLYQAISDGRVSIGVYRIGRSVRVDFDALLTALRVADADFASSRR